LPQRPAEQAGERVIAHRGTIAGGVNVGALQRTAGPVLLPGWLMLLRPLASASEIAIVRIVAAMLTVIRRGRWGR
jgi:hypothetical protein